MFDVCYVTYFKYKIRCRWPCRLIIQVSICFFILCHSHWNSGVNYVGNKIAEANAEITIWPRHCCGNYFADAHSNLQVFASAIASSYLGSYHGSFGKSFSTKIILKVKENTLIWLIFRDLANDIILRVYCSFFLFNAPQLSFYVVWFGFLWVIISFCFNAQTPIKSLSKNIFNALVTRESVSYE